MARMTSCAAFLSKQEKGDREKAESKGARRKSSC